MIIGALPPIATAPAAIGEVRLVARNLVPPKVRALREPAAAQGTLEGLLPRVCAHVRYDGAALAEFPAAVQAAELPGLALPPRRALLVRDVGHEALAAGTFEVFLEYDSLGRVLLLLGDNGLHGLR